MAAPRRTTVKRLIRADPADVYQAFLDPRLLAQWLPPAKMHGTVHALEPRTGGRIRMSLTYDDPSEGSKGKTTADADTFDGRIEELRPDRLVRWSVDFESDDPSMRGRMDVIWEIEPARDGSRVIATCEGIPPGIRLEDNETGSADSLAKLAGLVE